MRIISMLIMIMATVCLAGIKIGGILLGLSPFECVFYSSVITVFYSSLGGLRSVVITDIIQFVFPSKELFVKGKVRVSAKGINMLKDKLENILFVNQL